MNRRSCEMFLCVQHKHVLGMVYTNLGFKSPYTFRWKPEGIVVSAKICVLWNTESGQEARRKKKREKGPSRSSYRPFRVFSQHSIERWDCCSSRFWDLCPPLCRESEARERNRVWAFHMANIYFIWRKFFVTRKFIFILQDRLWIVRKNQSTSIVSVKVVILFWQRLIFNMRHTHVKIFTYTIFSTTRKFPSVIIL